jgi:type II secretory pathway component PulM
MTWGNINKPENSAITLTTGILIVVALYALVFSPLLNHSEQIQDELKAEKELTLYLDQAEQKLSTLSRYQALSKEQAKQQINAIFQAQGIQLNTLNMKDKSSIVSINSIAFNQLLNILQQLKDQYGIIVTKADIKRIKTGVVSAQLTFQFP